jgi:hypothetical protein
VRLPSPWPLLLALGVSACFDPQKVDPGPRVVDDCEDGDLQPSWSTFPQWKADSFTGDRPPTGPVDGGAVGGTGSLALEPGDGDQHALAATFELADMPDGVRQRPGAEVVTRMMGGTVDLTGFTQLVFDAFLEATPALPSANPLVVDLGCASFSQDPLASQAVMNVDLTSGYWVPFRLALADFQQQNTTHNQACLAQIDSLHFTILPGLADGQAASVTLHLDNIKLQN